MGRELRIDMLADFNFGAIISFTVNMSLPVFVIVR